MDNNFLFFCTFGMFLGVLLPRMLPITLLSKKKIPTPIQIWLSFVPPAILAALVAPEIFMQGEKFFISKDNVFLWAFIPTLITACFTKGLFMTLTVGMVTVALLRYFFY